MNIDARIPWSRFRSFAEAVRRDPDQQLRWVVLTDGQEDLLRQVYTAAKRYKVDLLFSICRLHSFSIKMSNFYGRRRRKAELVAIFKVKLALSGERRNPRNTGAWVTDIFRDTLELRGRPCSHGLRTPTLGTWGRRLVSSLVGWGDCRSRDRTRLL